MKKKIQIFHYLILLKFVIIVVWVIRWRNF